MSSVKRECQHDGPCCCNVVRVLKEGRVTSHILFKLKANGLGLSCPESEYGSQAIVKHIRECCGYGEFLDELNNAPVNTETLDKGYPNYSVLGDERFLLYLALMLDKNFGKSENYDRMFNCIPIIKRCLLEPKPNAGIKIIRINPFGRSVDIDRFLDFDFCATEIELFSQSIYMPAFDYSLSVSDIEAASTAGAEIPNIIAALCKNIRKEEVVSGIAGKYEPFIVVMKEWGFSAEGDTCESFVARMVYFNVTPEGKLKYEEIPTIDENIKKVLDHTHFVPADELEFIFRQASHFDFPVYYVDERVYLTKSFHKSAK